MMKHFFKLNYIFLLLVLFSCSEKVSPKGQIENNDVKVKAFSHLKLEGKFNVFYYKSDKDFVSVETYPSIFENLSIENKGDSLLIFENNETEKVDFYRVNVYSSKDIKSMKVSDSVEITANDVLKAARFNLKLNKHAKFIGEIEVDEAIINMTNLSLMNAKGKAKNVYLHIADTANYLSPYFVIGNMNLKAVNQTYTEMNVQDTIVGDIQNTSKVLYYNNPVRDFKIGDSTKVNHQKLN